jgi:hypothetical protein
MTRRDFFSVAAATPLAIKHLKDRIIPHHHRHAGKAMSPKVAQVQKEWWNNPQAVVAYADSEIAGMPQFPSIANGFGITSLKLSSGNVTITWQNGGGPFQLQRQGRIPGPWMNVGNPTMQRTRTTPQSGPIEFFRLQDAVPLLSISQNANQSAHLTWQVPDL